MKATAGLHHPAATGLGARVPEPPMRGGAGSATEPGTCRELLEEESLDALPLSSLTAEEVRSTRERCSRASARARGASPSTTCGRWGCCRDARLRGAARGRRLRPGGRAGGGPVRARSRLRRLLAERLHGARARLLAGHRGARRAGLRAAARPRSGCPSRWPTTSTSTPRSSTPRTSAGCSGRTPSRCCRTGATCRSGTTAAPGRSCRAGRRSGGPRGQRRPPGCRRPVVRAERATRHRARGRLRDRRAEPDRASRCRSSGRSTTSSAWCS